MSLARKVASIQAALLNKKRRVVSIVLTGGPCGGKSSALSRIKDLIGKKMSNVNYYTQQETATMLISNGASFPGFDSPQNFTFQIALCKFMMHTHDAFLAIADSSEKRSVIICDRGVLDNGAYMPSEFFDHIKRLLGIDRPRLLDRYQGVIHLQTAAIGAEKFYTVQNNKARTEGIEAAAVLDNKTKSEWQKMDHPRHYIIDNVPGQSFDDKMLRVEAAVTEILNASLEEEMEEVKK